MVRVLYFAGLREAFGKDREDVELPAPATVSGLIDSLRARGGEWASRLSADRRWRVAVNQEMATLDQAISPADEVAIFPPVTGG
jgi:sulfur-carrier protein